MIFQTRQKLEVKQSILENAKGLPCRFLQALPEDKQVGVDATAGPTLS